MKMYLYAAIAPIAAVSAFPANATTYTVAIPDTGAFQFLGNGNASVTYDGVTFSQSASRSNGNFFNVGTGFSGATSAVLSSQQQTTGLPNILITLPRLAYEISISFSTFRDSNVLFQFSNGEESLEFNEGNNFAYVASSMLNFTSPNAFNSILLIASDGAGNLNNGLNLGQIRYSDVTGGVPEPTTWAMMIGGFGFVGGKMRRRRVGAKVSFA